MKILLLLLAGHAFAIERHWILFPEEALYREQIHSAAVREGIDPALAMAVVAQESKFKWWAISPSGARGLMQVMPETALGRPGVRGECNDLFAAGQDLRAVSPNIRCGTRYLAAQIRACRGDLVCALASYNQGPGLTARSNGKPVTDQAIDYVPRVLAYRAIYFPKVTGHFWAIRSPVGGDISFLSLRPGLAPWRPRPRTSAVLSTMPTSQSPCGPGSGNTALQRPCCTRQASAQGNAWRRFLSLIPRF